MGKALVIKKANFAINAIDRVTPTQITRLVDFSGACDGNLLTYNIDLISTSAPDWVCFVQFAWQGGRTGEIRLFGFSSDDKMVQVGYTGNNQFYKCADKAFSASTIHNFDNAIRKIGFKKQNGHAYVTFDGVAWTQTEFTPSANVGQVYIWASADAIVQCPNLTELTLQVWNDPTYDISPLFSA